MSTPRTLLLLGATLTTGLSAGVIALYAHTIMPGLKTTSDRTFVAAFQAIDRAIINPWFMGTFFGALVLTAAAAATNRGRPAFAWLIVPRQANATVWRVGSVVAAARGVRGAGRAARVEPGGGGQGRRPHGLSWIAGWRVIGGGRR